MKNTSILLSALLLATQILVAQTEKSATPLPQNATPSPAGALAKEGQTQNSTRAVVVGISDYQTNGIPDLQFADRDAQAFADWLKSPAGGNVPPENMVLLLNEKATNGTFAGALDGLVDDCREGDVVIIYFSGHGDVEKKMIGQPGFLLCWDAPARVYMGGGAFGLNNLQTIISTLSEQNKARVVVITDACHAGKLSGNAIGGAQLTSANLARQFADELKIMSCQPNQYSIEGSQWGGGRGVFSFHLLEGLTGLADNDTNRQVSMFEIRQYLESTVPKETAPHQQLPFISGDPYAIVSQVDPGALATLRETKSGQGPALTVIKTKGFEESLLQGADSLLQLRYQAFQQALEKHQLLAPPDLCANDLYIQLIQEEQLKPLHNLMRRNLAAALQNDVQQAINALLDDDPYELNRWNSDPAKYAQYPRYLERAMELLGGEHYMYKPLKSKKLYFEGYLMAKNLSTLSGNPVARDSLRGAAKQKFLTALDLDPLAAYLYHAIGDLYFAQTPAKSDSVLVWCRKAEEAAPNWLTPMLEIAYEYLVTSNDARKAEPWVENAAQVRPESYLALERLSWLRQWQGRAEESKDISRQMIAQKPDLFNAYGTMAITLSRIEGDYVAAEAYARQAMALDSQITWAQEALIDALLKSGRVQAALEYLKRTTAQEVSILYRGTHFSYMAEAYFRLGDYARAIACADSMSRLNLGTTFYHVSARYWQGRALLAQGKTAEARQVFLEALELDPTINALFVCLYAWLGECARAEGKPDQAEKWLQKAVTFGFYGDGQDAPEPREEAHYLYGRLLLDQNRLPAAGEQFEQAVAVRRMGYWGEYGMALLAARNNEQALALDWVEKALNNLFPYPDMLRQEPLFSKIRPMKRFKELMAKRFPADWEKQ